VKKIAIIPTLLTLGNAVCGFSALAYASKIDGTQATAAYFALSGWFIILAMLFDALDGYVARFSRTASRFGGELDSLCDAISFGAAPAFLVMRMGPGWEPRPFLHQLLAGVATLYLVCALLRLARFNVENTPEAAANKRFRGLPSPGAAGCLASLAILRGEVANKWPGLNEEMTRGIIEACATVGALTVALLMVSRIPYPHMTKQVFRGRRPFAHLVEIIVAGFVLVMVREVALVLMFWVYGLGIPLRHTILRAIRRDKRPIPAGLDDVLPR
jgi:CDP-diacylglycerol--serine O-phosphatidyltransferase